MKGRNKPNTMNKSDAVKVAKRRRVSSSGAANFKLNVPYPPAGDQPQAIAELIAGVKGKMKEQTLLGVTGSGKTYTMANVIAAVGRPTMVLAHNKTLAAQLYAEFRDLFPRKRRGVFCLLL